MTTKRVVKKSASAKTKEVTRDDTQIVHSANITARVQPRKKGEKVKPAKMHAKCITIMLSVGSEDRARSIEQLTEDVKKALLGGKVKAKHVTFSGTYYILDGKVCLAADYDSKAQNFKEGAVPPPWAGGPAVPVVKQIVEKKTTPPRSPAEALRDLHENTEWGQRTQKERDAKALAREEDELIEFDWDEDDATDNEKMGAIADKSTKRAITRLRNSKAGKKSVKQPAKRIVKKSATKKVVVKKAAPQKVSRRGLMTKGKKKR